MDPAVAYRRVQARTTDLVDDRVADLEVPTCPGWTVKDLIAHNAGFITAFRSGDPKEAFGPDWGQREVDARKDRSFQECLDEWSELTAEADDLFESSMAPVAVSDVLAHEQDIRTAIGRAGGQEDENIVPAVEMALSFVEQKVQKEGLPAFRVVTDEIDRQVGEGEPEATLRTSTFELFRAVQGRRTVEQVQSLDWDGDPGPWMSAFFIFGPTDHKVEG
jgi:uncharacterized protein (TIGR03083 family)